MRVTFDDYMWLISEDRMLNKAYMSKVWGPTRRGHDYV